MKYCSAIFSMFFSLLLFIVPLARAEEVLVDKYLKVVDATKNYEQQDNHNTISVVGKLKNASARYIGDVVLEVRFFDADGKLIDAITAEQYSTVVPPRDNVAFVLSAYAQRQASEYATFKVRVTYAREKSSCYSSGKKGGNRFYSMLVNWAPLLIIMAFWGVLMVRFQKKSPQAKTLQLVEQQNELIRKNGEQFKEFLEIVREYTNRDS